MNTRRYPLIHRAAVAFSLLASFLVLLGQPLGAQDLDVRISVDGTPLITTQPVVREGSEWLVPLLPVARALSVQLEETAEPGTIRLKRANGVEYFFNGRTGEIRNRYLLIGRIAPNPTPLRALQDDMMFPLSGVVALFGVSAELDSDRNVLVIESNRDGSTDPSFTTGGPAFQLIDLNYSLGLTTNGKMSGQITSVQGQGLLNGAHLRGSLETTRASGRSNLTIAQTSLRVELSPQRAVLIGDQSTYSGLDALTLSVRGAGYEKRVGGVSSYYYVGRGRGSTAANLGTTGISRYDTTIGGFSLKKRNPRWEMNLAGNTFVGATRKGGTVGAALGSSRKRNQFKVQALVGTFSGANATGEVDGIGYGFVVTDTFTPVPLLSLTAQSEHYSRTFLTARDDTRYSGMTNTAMGVVFRPVRSLAWTAGVADRTAAGKVDRSQGYNYGMQYALGGRTSILWGYLRSVSRESISASGGRFGLTQYSVSAPHIHSYSFAAYYSQIQDKPGLLQDLSLFATSSTRLGQFGLHEQTQFGLTQRYGMDWLMNLGGRDSQIQVGADRVRSISGKTTFSPKAALRFPFFGGQSLQFKYSAEPGNHLLQIAITGPLIHRREVEVSSRGENLLVRSSDLKGRVYFDANNDARYQDSSDKPVAEVTLWLDDNRQVVTDAQGTFQFSQVSPGPHHLRADLAGVPADLVMVDNVERTVAVTPYGTGVQNFRVLRMGRISGKVTYMDYSGDTANPVERSLPDARVIIGPQLDTYSEANGSFLAGDLAPGEYQLTLDPSSIPEGYISKPESITVAAKPGQLDESARFLVMRAPRPVIEKKLPPQEVGLRAGEIGGNRGTLTD